MIKTHNITGLKYLCYHQGNEASCKKYSGSGTIWKRHLKKHGKDIHTEVMYISSDHSSTKIRARELSREYDVVNSPIFANLIEETADATGMHNKQTIEKSKAVQKERRLLRGGLTEKQKLGRKNAAIKMNHRFKGITMKERCGENWVNPLSGISYKERYGDNWVNPQKGISKRELYNNPNWVNPKKGKKFREIYNREYVYFGKKVRIKMIINNIETIYNTLKECSTATGLGTGVIYSALKNNGTYTFKNKSKRKKHIFPIGTTIKFIKIS